MSSGFKLTTVLCGLLFACITTNGGQLRVCADPNNLPFSDAKESGFESEIARILAQDLHQHLVFVWTPQRGEFLRKTIRAGKCDVVIGVPSSIEDLDTTRPYYRSSFVLVSRRDHQMRPDNFDDPVLRNATIGVQLLQHDGATVPAAQMLINHGLIGNIRWYRIFPDFSRANPSFAVLEAVEKREVDAAVAWGPVAGYYATKEKHDLVLTPIPADSSTDNRLTFDISMGVRRGNDVLRRQLNLFLRRRRNQVQAILKRFGVPEFPQPLHTDAEKKAWNDKS